MSKIIKKNSKPSKKFASPNKKDFDDDEEIILSDKMNKQMIIKSPA